MKKIIYLIWLFLAIAEAFLCMRFLLRLFGASIGAPFTQWVYASSEPLLYPFRGIFTTRVVEPGYIVEFSTLFAIIAYAIAADLLTDILLAIKRFAYERHQIGTEAKQ